MSAALARVGSDLKVLYANWFKPVRGETHEERLESFYATQADAYDGFRQRLLHGREHMLQCCSERLTKRLQRAQRATLAREIRNNLRDETGAEEVEVVSGGSASEGESIDYRPVWVDLGGGTGYNVEIMNSLMNLNHFHKVYIVDLCPSLCRVARKRVASLGLGNVEVVQGDACSFSLPSGERAALVTFSYSLSMIPPFFEAIDNAVSLVSGCEFAIVGCADFGVSKKFDRVDRQHGSLTRWFWTRVFETDNVFLGPERRAYLEHKFHTLYSYTAFGSVPYVPLLRAPFYVWIGALESDGEAIEMPTCTVPQTPRKFMRSFIYSMSWEDPREDFKVFPIGAADRVLSLTSGGCNILEMAAKGAEVVAVDLNAAQNALLQLKIAAIQSLDFENFWKLFGDGRHENFAALFESQLRRRLTPAAAEFWYGKRHYFKKSLYLHGGMGWVVWMISKLRRVSRSFDRGVTTMLRAQSLEEQYAAWKADVEPAVMRLAKMTDHQVFAWAWAGVPQRQKDMLAEMGGMSGWGKVVFDAVAKSTDIARDNYFYRVCLDGKYARECCPEYLKEGVFARLKSLPLAESVHVVHGKFLDALRSRSDYTRVILMDHLDWMDRESVEAYVRELAVRVVRGGLIIWRSASKEPFYAEMFAQYRIKGVKAYKVELIARDQPLRDRVNMYASFYRATRL